MSVPARNAMAVATEITGDIPSAAQTQAQQHDVNLQRQLKVITMMKRLQDKRTPQLHFYVRNTEHSIEVFCWHLFEFSIVDLKKIMHNAEILFISDVNIIVSNQTLELADTLKTWHNPCSACTNIVVRIEIAKAAQFESPLSHPIPFSEDAKQPIVMPLTTTQDIRDIVDEVDWPSFITLVSLLHKIPHLTNFKINRTETHYHTRVDLDKVNTLVGWRYLFDLADVMCTKVGDIKIVCRNETTTLCMQLKRIGFIDTVTVQSQPMVGVSMQYASTKRCSNNELLQQNSTKLKLDSTTA